MNRHTSRRVAAASMSGAAALAIAGFTALGAIFDYPQILKKPTTQILVEYREHQSAVTGWFLVLVVSAALLVPIGMTLGRSVGGIRGRWITGVGVAAAAVQVVGLSRWVLFIPGVSRDAAIPVRSADAHRTFESLHFWLGTIVGETIGYALTATFTVLVIIGLRRLVPLWLRVVGYAAAALIATGVTIPLGLHAASLTNFAGYVAWCLWLIAMAVVLFRTTVTARQIPASTSLRVQPSRVR